MHSYKLLVLLMVGIMAGCAGEGVKDEATATTDTVEPSKESVPANTSSATTDDKGKTKAQSKSSAEPKTAIDAKVLYLLLTAELAGQRNLYDVALEGYMQAASQVQDSRIAERAAKIAVFLQDNKKADEAVNLWLKEDGNNLNAQMLAALTALRSGHKAESLKHLEALLKLDPAGFENTLQELLKTVGQTDKVDFVIGVLDDLAVKNPDRAVLYYTQALLAMQKKDNRLAEEKLQKTLQLQPAWDKALVAQAQLAVLNEDLDKAESLLRADIAKYPEELRFKRMLAQLLIKATKFDAAMEVYREVLVAHPDDGDSLFSLALLHLQLQQDAEAKKYLDQLVNRPEWSGQASLYLGKLAAKEGQLTKALSWFDSVTRGPAEFDAAMSAASLLMEERRFEEAMQRVTRLQDKFPSQRVRILAIQAEIFNGQKQYSKAYKVLSDALAEIPEQKELLYTRSLVAERMGDLASMEKDLRLILRDHPDDVASLNALGYTLANKTQRLKEAESYIKKALALQPDMAVVMDSYGWLLFKQGKYTAAYDYLSKAYEKQAEPEIAGHLVEVLLRLGRTDEAKKVFEKALANTPKDDYLLEVKKRLFDRKGV